MTQKPCFHCDLPVTESGRWQVEHAGSMHDVCCAGCQAVALTIRDAGLSGYYKFRSKPALTGQREKSKSAPPWTVYDEPELLDRYCLQDDDQSSRSGSIASEPNTATMKSVSLAVEGLRCGACVWLIETALRTMPGVAQVRVNLASSRVQLRFDPKQTKLSTLLQQLDELGYASAPLETAKREHRALLEGRRYLQRLFVAGLVMMQSMMFALPAYFAGYEPIEASYEQLFRWASAVLAVPVVFYSGLPFLRNAWRNLVTRHIGMDVPVALVVLIAFSSSIYSTATGSGEVYFDSIAMFIFLLTGARYIEWSARRNATRSIRAMDLATPDMARLANNESEGSDTRLVPAARLQPSDIIIVSEGDRIPVDGIVIRGNSTIDRSIVSGESVPVAIGPGDSVLGGALLCANQIAIRVSKPLSKSTFSMIQAMANRGLSEKPPFMQLVDRIASYFVIGLLLAASATLVIWWQIEPSRALEVAIAVLVISCPCALSLATPAALTAATDRLLRERLLIARGQALPVLATVTDVVFDKTGTLTTGRLALSDVACIEGITRQDAIDLAAQILAQSSHPIAKAVKRVGSDALLNEQPIDTVSRILASVRTANSSNRPTATLSVESKIGHGLKIVITDHDGQIHELLAGSASWCAVSHDELLTWRAPNQEQASALSELFVAYRVAGQREAVTILSRMTFSDTVREESARLISSLRTMGMTVHLLSGDQPGAVRRVAAMLGIESFESQATPARKVAFVKDLQQGGKIVAMIGDGLNDAPVLSVADVSVSIGSASNLTQTMADVVCLADQLEPVRLLFHSGRQTMRVIRQNLVWALSYNVIAIPLAATGLIAPWVAAIGMASSSLLVVLNATRLSKPDRTPKKLPALLARRIPFTSS